MAAAATMTELFGPQLQTKEGLKPTAEVLQGKKLIGIYFSAHWCPPCRGFTPVLAESYSKHLQGKGMEIVFVSSDRDQSAFDGYYGEQPWTALPYDARGVKEKMGNDFGVRGIPMLIILDAEGNMLTNEGRKAICDDKTGGTLNWGN